MSFLAFSTYLSLLSVALIVVQPFPSLAAPSGAFVTHEKRDASPYGWIKREPVEVDRILPVRVGLVQSNFDRGHNMLMDISEPRSTNYAKHLNSDEVIELFAPSEDAVRGTLDWLDGSKIGRDRIAQTRNREWLAFMTSAQELDDLLQTKFHDYARANDGATTVAYDE